MKKLLTIFIISLISGSLFSQNISPYFEGSKKFSSEAEAVTTVVKAMNDAGFRQIGDFRPGKNNSLRVVLFTRPDLESLAAGAGERGALAAAVKLGFKSEKGSTTVTVINTDYIFNAYFGEPGAVKITEGRKITDAIAGALRPVLGTLTPMGGEVDKAKLQRYKYMMGMPTFNDPVTIGEFASFSNGVETIEKNLKAAVGGTAKVYSLGLS